MLMVAIRDEEDDMGLISNKKKTSIRNCFFFSVKKEKNILQWLKEGYLFNFRKVREIVKKALVTLKSIVRSINLA